MSVTADTPQVEMEPYFALAAVLSEVHASTAVWSSDLEANA